jgi:hypothetical protein
VPAGHLLMCYAIPLEERRRVEGFIDTERIHTTISEVRVRRVERVECDEGRNDDGLVLGSGPLSGLSLARAAARHATIKAVRCARSAAQFASSPSPSSSSIARRARFTRKQASSASIARWSSV